MKKRILTITLLLCLGILLVGCNGAAGQPPLEKVTFSNLVEEETQKEVADLMDEAGISDARQTVFFDHVKQFNKAVSADSLTKGYEEAGILDMKYDPYEMQDEWMAKYPDFLGYNCRITAYSLFGDYISLPHDEVVRDDMVLMDLSALEEDASAMEVVDRDLDRFKVLYSTVPTEATKDIETHVKHVQADWADRGISFKENDKASLVTVWIHEQFDEDYLFIGHVGVLFETDDGLYFVEKLAFQEPYQISKFDNRTELSDYMMIKYDIATDQPTAATFIMENDQLMEGYRENPNKG